MSAFITIVHVLVCLVLIIAVLLQSGKSADLAGAFGGGGSQSVFGPRGAANILTKLTTACAVLFMFTSLGLWILSDKGAKSVVTGEEEVPVDKPAVTETVKPEQTPATQEKKQAAEPAEKDKKTPEKKKSEPEKKEKQ